MNGGTPGQRPAPVVGVTTYREEAAWSVWRQPAALIPQSYVECVLRAGGTAVLLPPQPDAGAGRVVRMLDALVLSGGPDIDPARYGAAPGPHTGPPHAARDAWELALARAALEGDLPVLGVCRGMQLLNVALGGTLVQHLPGDGHREVPARFVRRGIRTAPGTRVAAALGAAAGVDCYHHQAVGRLADALAATAWAADDGTVEAVEAREAVGAVEALEPGGHRFVVGVQWHPETDQDDLRLFQALVAAGLAAAARKETAV